MLSQEVVEESKEATPLFSIPIGGCAMQWRTGSIASVGSTTANVKNLPAYRSTAGVGNGFSFIEKFVSVNHFIANTFEGDKTLFD